MVTDPSFQLVLVVLMLLESRAPNSHKTISPSHVLVCNGSLLSMVYSNSKES